MSGERPIEIEHLPPRLHRDFDGLIVPVSHSDPDHVETNFCSRALAAFTIQRVSGCSLQQAADSLVDGGNDGGIDAVHHCANTNTLWCVQSKFTADGLSEPALQEVTRFSTGMDALLGADFTELRNNAAWQSKLVHIEHLLNTGGLSVRAVLVYSGIRLVSDDRRRLFEAIRARVSADDDYFEFQTINLTTIHDWIVGAEENRSVDRVELCIRKAGWLREPHEIIYGLIPLSEIAALSNAHGSLLVASNIRRFKGSTEVNENIANTVREDPTSFLYLNNGFTAYCARFEVRAADRGNQNQKSITAFGFSIVNGAQTLGALTNACTSVEFPDGHAFIRIISMEHCEDDREFAEKITRCTNTQNEILTLDYLALDPEQERISNQLAPSEITYHYKLSADTVPQDDYNFTILEATTAAACLVHDGSCDLISRVLSNRKSLWSTDTKGQETISRYARIFSSVLSARSLWRAVLIQRIVLEKCREYARAEPVRRTFFENARWLILELILHKLRIELGVRLNLSAEEAETISRAALEVSEEVWEVSRSQGYIVAPDSGSFTYPRHLRSVFSSSNDCRQIRAEVFRRRIVEAQVEPAA